MSHYSYKSTHAPVTPPASEVALCKVCQAPIIRAYTERGRIRLMDSFPTPAGTWKIEMVCSELYIERTKLPRAFRKGMVLYTEHAHQKQNYKHNEEGDTEESEAAAE